MNKIELLEMIENGENSYVEFKLDSINPNDLAEEIVAFANAEGGIILLGVDDDGDIEGITRADLEEWTMDICRANCDPGILPFFEIVKKVEDNKDIGILTIPRGFVHKTNRGRWFIRVGSTKRDATTEELARLFQQRGLVHYDIAPVPRTSWRAIDKDRLDYYWTRILKRSIKELDENLENLLLNTRIMVETKEGRFLSIAGALVFGNRPQDFLPQAGIKAVRFRGTEPDYETLDKQDIEGALVNSYSEDGTVKEDGVIDLAIKFVERNTSTFSKMEGVIRKDIPQYRKESIREAIVNDVVHRHYSIMGAKIRLFIFDDRIEIRSPGKIPNTVTIEQMKVTSHYSRNPEIVKFLTHYGYVEDIGLGIPNKIFRLSLQHSGIEPKLEEIGEEFIVTLFPARPA
jgi:ATP-dependent DNA helicase RecG